MLTLITPEIDNRKQKLFDLTKWIITLQSLVLGLSFSKETNFSPMICILPIFIGVIGLSVNFTISKELKAHRETLAKLRHKIGGLVYEMNKDQADYFLHKKKPSHHNYFFSQGLATSVIILLSSLLSILIITSAKYLSS